MANNLLSWRKPNNNLSNLNVSSENMKSRGTEFLELTHQQLINQRSYLHLNSVCENTTFLTVYFTGHINKLKKQFTTVRSDILSKCCVKSFGFCKLNGKLNGKLCFCLYINSSINHRLRAKSFLLCNVGSCPAGLLFDVVLQTFGKDARHLAQECKSRNLLSECAKRNFKLS